MKQNVHKLVIEIFIVTTQSILYHSIKTIEIKVRNEKIYICRKMNIHLSIKFNA